MKSREYPPRKEDGLLESKDTLRVRIGLSNQRGREEVDVVDAIDSFTWIPLVYLQIIRYLRVQMWRCVGSHG